MDKETLRQYRPNRLEILQLREAIDDLWGRLLAPGTTKYSGMPTARGGNSDPTGDGVAAEDALLRKYMKEHRELCAQQLEIENAIGTLDKELRTIMRYRYILGYKWETICNKMGSDEYGPMDWTTVHRKHRKALRLLAEI